MATNVHQALQTKLIHRPLSMVVTLGDMARTRDEYHQKAKLEQACMFGQIGLAIYSCPTHTIINPPWSTSSEKVEGPKSFWKY